jgi:phosphoenolpyruvate carboxykinase (GTP)
MSELLKVDPDELKLELPAIQEHLARFGDRLPKELRAQLAQLEERLGGK